MAISDLKHAELTGKIIACAMQVHNTLGNGFQERIYQRAMAIEMRYAGLTFNQEFEMTVFYRNEIVGTRRVDFLVEGFISTELKAIIRLEPADLNQAMNYLEVYNLETGLLINFGSPSLVFHRFRNKKFKPELNRGAGKGI